MRAFRIWNIWAFLGLGCFFPISLVSQSSQNAASLLDIYHQGKRSNCGSVAMTKLIISQFGVFPKSGPFSKTEIVGTGFSVLLIDGSAVVVTLPELEMATKESRFLPANGSGYLQTANTLYAAMAVRRAGAHDGRQISKDAFKKALKTLGSGGDPADADVLPALLGYGDFAELTSPWRLPQMYLVGSNRHIAFVSGVQYDEHGSIGGEGIVKFNQYYGTPTMYAYALTNNGEQIVRACSDGNPTWNPGTATWRQCRSDEVTGLQRK